MSLPRVEVDATTRYAYIALADSGIDGVRHSVPLQRQDPDDPEALDSIVLDFDRDGRLVGIEIATQCDTVLRPETISLA